MVQIKNHTSIEYKITGSKFNDDDIHVWFEFIFGKMIAYYKKY